MVNPTTYALARLAGITDDAPSAPTGMGKIRALNNLLDEVQSRPEREQDKIFSELAATYLPELGAAFREETGPANCSMVLMNAISHTPYFVRFAGLPEMRDLIYHQANRMAQSAVEVPNMPHEIVGQFAQFLSTLLVMQDPSHVAEADKTILLRNLRLWSRRFGPYSFASQATDRCYSQLMNTNGEIRKAMRSKFRRELMHCGSPRCGASKRHSNSGTLKQCSRCKAAVYCGEEHQRQAWPLHKATCFQTTF